MRFSNSKKRDELANAGVAPVRCPAALRNGEFPGLLSLILAALLSGCAGATGATDVARTNSSTHTDIASGLHASPSSVSFGNVNSGSNSARNVTVANSGTSNVSIANVIVSGAGFDTSGVPTGLILTPGQSAVLAVTFTPASAGNVSGDVTLATNPPGPPLAIPLSGMGVTPTTHSVTLTWNASTTIVAGYNMYRATAPAGPYTSLNSTPNPQLQWTDSTVQPGTTYYYVVTAVASDTAESAYSDQASAAIPEA